MLTLLFLSVAIAPPVVLTEETAEISYYREDPTKLVLFVRTHATHKVWGEFLELKRVPQAPPKVLLLQVSLRIETDKENIKFDSDQTPGYVVSPYRPDRDGELTEVRIRDPYGREISRFPVKYPKPRPK
jgi:hypothetical protein